MFAAIGTAIRKPFEFIGVLSKPDWVLTAEEEEMGRIYEEFFKEKPVVFTERQGLVTQLTNDAIELNHRWIYQLVKDNDNFAVGDIVSWKEYKTEGGEVVVKDVVRVEDKGMFDLLTVHCAKITKVDHKKFETNKGIIFDLEQVQCDLEFRPELADNVNLECTYLKKVSAEEEEFDPDPNYIVVKRVVPSSSKLVAGTITSFDASKSKGVVNSDIIFHQNVCDQLIPTVGAAVACNCVKGDYAEFQWRAYNMTKSSYAPSSNKRHFFAVEPIPHFDLVLGETKIVELRVTNSSNDPICVEGVKVFERNKIYHVKHEMKLPYIILPQTTVSWPIEVKGCRLGRQELNLQWHIARKKFPISTHFRFTTVQQNLGEAGGRNPARDRRRAQLVVPGQRRVRNPVFRRVAVKEYSVPEKLRDICSSDDRQNLTEVQIALQKERPIMADGLCAKNYAEYMHTLLFIEEIGEEKFFERLATRSSLYRTREFVTFNFSADSEYNKIVCGDTVLASKPWESIKYEGRVWVASSVQLGLKFSPDFENSMTSGAQYDLEFRMNRGPHRRRHHAVDLVLQNLGPEWLFPSSAPEENNTPEIVIDKWFNGDLNYEQKSAVKNIIAKRNLPYPYIIYGPPGTGKTVTVVETILQIISHQKDYRILVTAPTNSAVDTLGLRLLEFGVFEKLEMVRLSSYNAYTSGSIAVQLMDISMVPSLGDPANDAPLRDSENIPTMYLDDISNYKIMLGTLATISYLNSAGVAKGYFTHIIIDEAGQSHEPESLLPIALVDKNKTQLILAGDPQQLGPVTNSMLAKQYSFDRSLLDRLTHTYLYRKKVDAFKNNHGYNPSLITRLVLNYRSLPKIVDLVGSIFYGGDLKATIPEVGSREGKVLSSIMIHREAMKDQMESMVFINVNTPEEQIDGSSSWFNQGEIAQVFFILNFLYNAKVSPDDIGIITPYALQVKKIYEYLDTLGVISPKVASVEEFQGQERDVIILSIVRNNFGVHKALSSFVTDQHRVNVAMSRARVLNIIIGNRSTLVMNPLWSLIVNKCRLINLASTPIEDTVD